MATDDTPLPWSDDQWNTVRRVVLESARRSRVASSFLPLVGPLPGSTTTVPTLKMREEPIAERQRGEASERLDVNETDVIPLTTISVEVYLRGSEVAEPDLASALAMFARAAEVVARVEDALVFTGTADRVKPAIYTLTSPPPVPGSQPPAKGGSGSGEPGAPGSKEKLGGLLGAGELKVTVGEGAADAPAAPRAKGEPAAGTPTERPSGNDVVNAVVAAIQALEGEGHYGPFACVLGHGLFRAATNPTGSLVLPTDRITPFLDGQPVLRSSTLPAHSGVLVALASNAVDLVVATDITVKYLQTTLEPRYVFRVYERIALRVKQEDAVCVLET